MAQAPKMTPEEWADARQVWERDDREGFTWLVNERALPVSPPAVRKTANKQGWAKSGGSPAKPSKPSRKRGVEIVESPQAKAKSSRGAKPKQASETIETMGETIETMDGEGEELEDAEFEPADQIPPGCRTRARTKIGAPGLDDPAIGELLEYDPGDLADLFEPDFPNRGLYRPQFVRVAYKFFLLGATVEQLADVLCVDSRTIYRWAKDHPAFDMAMRGGREMADANVASRLYARAMGYSHEEEEIKVIDNKVVRVPTVKHYPPDPGAAIFWLKNRQPELWKERVEVKEQPTIALVDKQAMDEIYRNALEHAAQVQERMMGRAERMGLTIDQGLDDGE